MWWLIEDVGWLIGLEMWWRLIGNAPDYGGNGPEFESGISHSRKLSGQEEDRKISEQRGKPPPEAKKTLNNFFENFLKITIYM